MSTEKRARELEILASKSPELLKQDAVDDIYKVAGEIISKELHYTCAIVCKDGDGWLLKYISIPQKMLSLTKKLTGLDSENFKMAQIGMIDRLIRERKPFLLEDSRTATHEAVQSTSSQLPSGSKYLISGLSHIIDFLVTNIFPEMNKKVIISPIFFQGDVDGFIAVFGDNTYKEDIPTIHHFSQLVGTAVETKVIECSLYENEAKLRALSHKIISMQEEERARMSRDIHDQIGKLLTGLSLEAAWIKRKLKSHDGDISSLMEMIENAAEEVRRTCQGLRPMELDDIGLRPALEQLIEEASKIYDFEIKAALITIERDEICEDAAICIYRILQETLTNVAKHSGASVVTIALEKRDDVVTLNVFDDGRGFNLSDGAGGGGLGISGMRERAALCNGSIDIDAEPGNGVLIMLQVPLIRQGREFV